MTTTKRKPAHALLALLGAALLTSGSAHTVLAQPAQHAAPAAITPAPTEQAQEQARKNAAKPKTAKKPQEPAKNESVFDQQIREGKITTCGKVFGVLGRGLTEGFVYSVRSQWNAQAVNSHAIQSLVALKPPTGTPAEQQAGAGILFTAPVGKSCEGSLVRVMPLSKNCVEIAAELTKANGHNSSLGDLPVMAMPNGAQIMLIPSDKTCIAVTVVQAASAE
ncbi:MAG: hypothetical protein FWD79_12465 [Desulfobulbus sp.]|nr:hypothetical protein [Desulfobulbus sp.]